jgi:hypothetical protein
VQDLEVGVQVWTINKVGKKVAVPIEKVSKTQVPSMHKVVHLILSDGRELFVSPGHPAVNGRIVGDFVPNDIYEGASVVSAELVAYEYEFTYDILAAGSTGFYFANGILLDSTLH